MIDCARRLSLSSWPVFEQDARHVDGALVMRDHHANEIAVDVAARRDLHAPVHARVHVRHLGIEVGLRRLRGETAHGSRAAMLVTGGLAACAHGVAGLYRELNCCDERRNHDAGEGGRAQRGNLGPIVHACHRHALQVAEPLRRPPRARACSLLRARGGALLGSCRVCCDLAQTEEFGWRHEHDLSRTSCRSTGRDAAAAVRDRAHRNGRAIKEEPRDGNAGLQSKKNPSLDPRALLQPPPLARGYLGKVALQICQGTEFTHSIADSYERRKTRHARVGEIA